MILSQSLNETIPTQYLQTYGQAVNSGYCLGIVLINLIACFLVPLPENGSQALLDDQNWRIIFGAPIVVSIVAQILILTMFSNPSLKELINSSSPCDVQIQKIYRTENIDLVKNIYLQNKS